MIWTVIIVLNNVPQEYGTLHLNTRTHDRAPAWRLAQQQIGNEGIVVALIKGSHEISFKEDLT
jgi:hypothetical protein